MLDSRGKTKGGWFFILGFNMLKPNMSNTISIGTCSSDLYIHYFFETSGTASCGTTGIHILLYIYISPRIYLPKININFVTRDQDAPRPPFRRTKRLKSRLRSFKRKLQPKALKGGLVKGDPAWMFVMFGF